MYLQGYRPQPRQCKAYSQTSYRPYYMQAFFIFVTYRDIPPIWDPMCCWAYPTTDRAYSPSYRTISVAGPISPGYGTGLYRKKSEMPVPARPFWSMTYTAPYCRPAMEICWNPEVCYQCNNFFLDHFVLFFLTSLGGPIENPEDLLYLCIGYKIRGYRRH